MRAPVQAIVFDFDGLILDTEGALYAGWAACYAEHGGMLTADYFAAIVGTTVGHDELFSALEGQIGRPIARESAHERVREHYLALIHALPILPGVAEVINAARVRDMAVGVASNSTSAWVEGHLERLRLRDRVRAIRCRDDVIHPKPHPAVYHAVLADLGVAPHDAIAFEDSPTGVAAARAAGCGVVAVPNPLTARLDLSAAHLRLDSLADRSLDEMMALVAAVR